MNPGVLESSATWILGKLCCCRITWPNQVTQDICRLKRAFPTKPQLCKNGWATAVSKEAETENVVIPCVKINLDDSIKSSMN